MPEFKNKIKAKRRVYELFSPSKDPIDAAKGVSDDELIEMLDAVQSVINNPRKSIPEEVSMLVFAGSVRFDRWFSPTPFVVKPSQRSIFRKFVAAMKHIEAKKPVNYPVFEVHALRDQLYADFSGIPIGEFDANELNELEIRLSKISTPLGIVKTKEFEEQKNKMKLIIDGIKDGSLRTTMTFRVPYVLSKKIVDLKFTRRGVAASLKIKPQFKPAEETFLSTDGVALPVGASRWQTGTSEIFLELAMLMDGSAYSESLQSILGHDLPVDGWPQSFTTAFEIFHDIVWNVRGRPEFHQDWIPAPRDISDLTFQLGSAADERIEWIVKGSPAALLEVFSPTEEVEEIFIGELTRIPWDLECRSRAQMYLELGDTNEALFWVNVSVEALIIKRFQEIEDEFGLNGLADKINSPKEFWANSEEIVAKQYPHMAGKIQWPASPIHVSIFGKIKALYRLVPMRRTEKELIKKYRIISGNRNDLFHGKQADRTSIVAVLNAIEAIEWIEENMWPAMPE